MPTAHQHPTPARTTVMEPEAALVPQALARPPRQPSPKQMVC